MIFTLILGIVWMLATLWTNTTLFSPWWFLPLWVMECLLWFFLWVLLTRTDIGGE